MADPEREHDRVELSGGRVREEVVDDVRHLPSACAQPVSVELDHLRRRVDRNDALGTGAEQPRPQPRPWRQLQNLRTVERDRVEHGLHLVVLSEPACGCLRSTVVPAAAEEPVVILARAGSVVRRLLTEYPSLRRPVKGLFVRSDHAPTVASGWWQRLPGSPAQAVEALAARLRVSVVWRW